MGRLVAKATGSNRPQRCPDHQSGNLCRTLDYLHRIEELEAMLAQGGFIVESIPREALFLAGKAFLQYRRRKGTKNGGPSGFFIGAHASVLGIPLLTRDVGKYASYFPHVTLITPESAE